MQRISGRKRLSYPGHSSKSVYAFQSQNPSRAAADVITFDVFIDTRGLEGHVAGPFTLDVQLLGGSDLAIANTVRLKELSFSGGSSIDGPAIYGSGASINPAGCCNKYE